MVDVGDGEAVGHSEVTAGLFQALRTHLLYSERLRGGESPPFLAEQATTYL